MIGEEFVHAKNRYRAMPCRGGAESTNAERGFSTRAAAAAAVQVLYWQRGLLGLRPAEPLLIGGAV
jgi:hypothetical protein